MAETEKGYYAPSLNTERTEKGWKIIFDSLGDPKDIYNKIKDFEDEFDKDYYDLLAKELVESSHYYHNRGIYCLKRLGVI